MIMKKSLDSFDCAVLGESSGKLHLSGVTECREAALCLSRQATRSIYIFSYDLDSQIYNQGEFIEAVKNLAIRSEHSRIKILLQNNDKVQREGHRLIQLWRRLTSKIELRRPSPDYIDHTENFLLVDETGYLHRKLYTNYEAAVDFNSRFETNRFVMFFNEVWEQSEPDSELRNLHI
jgi:hypothetical protein